MIQNIIKSEIDGNGDQYYCGLLEKAKFNSRKLWDGCMAFDITNNHKRQTATISVFMWRNGTPWNWKVIKVIRGEVIGEIEIEAVLQKYGVIKGGGNPPNKRKERTRNEQCHNMKHSKNMPCQPKALKIFV